MGESDGASESFHRWGERRPLYAAVVTTIVSELLLIALLWGAAQVWNDLGDLLKSRAFWFFVGVVPAGLVGAVLSVRTVRRAEARARETEAVAAQKVEFAVKAALALDGRDRVRVGADLAQIAPPVAPDWKVRLVVPVLLLGGRQFVGPGAKIHAFDVFFNIGPSILGGRIPLRKRNPYHSFTENDVVIDAECFLDDETANKILNFCVGERFPYLVIASARVVVGDLDVEKVRSEVPLGVYGGRSEFPMAKSPKAGRSKEEEYGRTVATQYLFAGYQWGKTTKRLLVVWSKMTGNTHLVGPFDPVPVLPMEVPWFLQAGEVRVALERLDALLKEVTGPPEPRGFSRLLNREGYGTAAEAAFTNLEKACGMAAEAHGLASPVEVPHGGGDGPTSYAVSA